MSAVLVLLSDNKKVLLLSLNSRTELLKKAKRMKELLILFLLACINARACIRTLCNSPTWVKLQSKIVICPELWDGQHLLRSGTCKCGLNFRYCKQVCKEKYRLLMLPCGRFRLQVSKSHWREENRILQMTECCAIG